MRHVVLASVTIFALVCLAAGDEPGQPVPLTLLPAPEITLAEPMEATQAEATEIRRLIKALAEIDSPDYGYCSTVTGDAFVPIPSSAHFHSMSVPGHELKTSDTFKKLVEFGPKGLPFLLTSLDDETPTQLKIERRSRKWSMWLGHEISGNPTNEGESAALKNADAEQLNEIENPYTVRIGDICFMALGQITNRPYYAVRYEMTACVVVNSPVQDGTLVEEVRAIWNDADPAQQLLHSLLIDFHTRGDGSERFQGGAAMRLAYFFPKESLQVLLDRIKDLDVTTTDAWLIKAVSVSGEPAIRDEMFNLFKRATDKDVLVACLPAIGKDRDAVVLRRLEEVSTKGYESVEVLRAIRARYPVRAREIFLRVFKRKSVECRAAACLAWPMTDEADTLECLMPLLEDKRASGLRDNEELKMRVCDLAAERIASNCPELKFKWSGRIDDMDRQIDEMKRKIAEMKMAEK